MSESMSEVGRAAVDAITATATSEIAKVEDYWRSQIDDGGEQPPEPPDLDVTTIGMSAPADKWNDTLDTVGPEGVTARRIFAKLRDSSGRDQSALIAEAIEQRMLPVVSYKVNNVANAIRGDYDAWVENCASYLDGLGVPVVVCVWHEPHGDMTATQFVQLQERLMPKFKRGDLIPGPFLNGWLLDNKRDTFKSYMSDKLLTDVWEFVGIDTYQDDNNPDATWPGKRIPALLSLLDDMGYPDMRVGVGEYNAFDADALADAGETFLSETRCRFACVWNDTEGLGQELEGERLAAYQATKADERARQEW